MQSAVICGLQLYFIVTKIVTSLLSGAVVDGCLEPVEAPLVSRVRGRSVGRCARFMPRLLVLTTLPHRRPKSHQFERVNGRHSLRMCAPRLVGLPYGSYPRLLLVYLTTEAVRTKSPEIYLGATPNGLARKLALSTISGPRGTAQRLADQLRRLLSTRWGWRSYEDTCTGARSQRFVSTSNPSLQALASSLLLRRSTWDPRVVLDRHFFREITRSAVPVDLRAIRRLRGSPLAIDLYVWLTYRMSYLRKPTSIPWESLEAQFGADYSRRRDFRRKALVHLEDVLRVYPTARLGQVDSGLLLHPSPPHVPPSKGPLSLPFTHPSGNWGLLPGERESSSIGIPAMNQ